MTRSESKLLTFARRLLEKSIFASNRDTPETKSIFSFLLTAPFFYLARKVPESTVNSGNFGRHAPRAPDFKFQSFSCTLLAQVISNTTRFSTRLGRGIQPRRPCVIFSLFLKLHDFMASSASFPPLQPTQLLAPLSPCFDRLANGTF